MERGAKASCRATLIPDRIIPIAAAATVVADLVSGYGGQISTGRRSVLLHVRMTCLRLRRASTISGLRSLGQQVTNDDVVLGSQTLGDD